MKQAMMVFGALAFRWLAIEMPFKIFLDKARAGVGKSDPQRDMDDVNDIWNYMKSHFFYFFF